MPKINVYDFDDTIYHGDSSIDFFLFCLKKRKIKFSLLVVIFYYTILYICKKITTKKYKEIFFSFLKDVEDIDNLVLLFWTNHKDRLKPNMLDILSKNKNNYIISASPEFLLKSIIEKYHAVLIATKMDKMTGKIEGENCNKEEKVRRLNKVCPKYEIVEFYSDSFKDLPLARLSKKPYMVNKNKIEPWNPKTL